VLLLPILTITLSFIHVALAAAPKPRIDNIIWAPRRSTSAPSLADVGQQALPEPSFIPSSSSSPVAITLTQAPKKRTPTRAKRAGPSNVPFSGNIRVNKVSNGAFLGYVNNPGALSRHGLVGTTANALTVSGVGTSDSTGPIEITKTNGPSTTYPFFGVIGYSTTLSNNNQWVGSTGHTAANAPATAMPGTSPALYYESTVWTYNTVTHGFTVQWVNPDGSKVNGILWFLNGSIYVMATAPTTTDSSYAITLSLVI